MNPIHQIPLAANEALPVNTFTNKNSLLTKIFDKLQKDASKRTYKWQPEEDQILKEAVEKEEMTFDDIAKNKFNDQKSVKACITRYQNALAPGIDNSEIRLNEIDILVGHIRNPNPTVKVRELLPGRCSIFIHHKVKSIGNILDKTDKYKRWTVPEELKLLEAADKLKKNWDKVSQEIKGKTAAQCENHYRYLLKTPNVERRDTRDDDEYTPPKKKQKTHHD